jgi:hypothetical protein
VARRYLHDDAGDGRDGHGQSDLGRAAFSLLHVRKSLDVKISDGHRGAANRYRELT